MKHDKDLYREWAKIMDGLRNEVLWTLSHTEDGDKETPAQQLEAGKSFTKEAVIDGALVGLPGKMALVSVLVMKLPEKKEEKTDAVHSTVPEKSA